MSRTYFDNAGNIVGTSDDNSGASRQIYYDNAGHIVGTSFSPQAEIREQEESLRRTHEFIESIGNNTQSSDSENNNTQSTDFGTSYSGLGPINFYKNLSPERIAEIEKKEKKRQKLSVIKWILIIAIILAVVVYVFYPWFSGFPNRDFNSGFGTSLIRACLVILYGILLAIIAWIIHKVGEVMDFFEKIFKKKQSKQ